LSIAIKRDNEREKASFDRSIRNSGFEMKFLRLACIDSRETNLARFTAFVACTSIKLHEKLSECCYAVARWRFIRFRVIPDSPKES